MTPRLSDERGFALVPALMIMMCFLVIGVALLDTIDVQQRESRRERQRESSFQLAEGVLNAQIYRLGVAWPGQLGGAFPSQCGPAVVDPDCPSEATLKATFDEVDFGAFQNVQWTTALRDNAMPTKDFYSDALLTNGTPTWDANGDNQVWVRAQARLRPPSAAASVPPQVRTLVALVRAELLPSNFIPNKTLVAGWFETTNSGNKAIIDNGATGEVVVRNCATATTSPTPVTGSDPSCATFDAGKEQVYPPNRITSQRDFPDAVDHEAGLDALRATAESQGNYYTSCPPSLQGDIPGEVVFIENVTSAQCRYTGNASWNTPSQPGAVVIARGSVLDLAGTGDFYGMIYHANLDDESGLLIDLRGNTRVRGGVVIDGPGGVAVGSSGGNGNPKPGNLQHNPNAGGPLKVFGTAAIVHNSFREIQASN